jgi:hypothetical protein
MEMMMGIEQGRNLGAATQPEAPCHPERRVGHGQRAVTGAASSRHRQHP